MAEGKEPSFGRLVFNRAWFGAWGLFDSWQKDTALALVSVAVGEASYYRQHGLPATMLDGIYNALHLVAPLALVWFVLFVWHFWLAPAALAYEAMRDSSSRGGEPSSAIIALPREPQINWGAWKHRSKYNISELAALLAKADPNAAENSETTSFRALLTEDVMNRQLKVTRDRRAENYYEPDLWPTYFDVSKEDAMKWAMDKDFDLSHIA